MSWQSFVHLLGKRFRSPRQEANVQVETLHAEASPQPDNYVDARDCGLFDAFKSGWFLNDSSELFKGFSIQACDVVVDFGCGAGGSTLFCARTGAHVVFIDSEAEKVAMVSAAAKQTNARIVEGYICSELPIPLPNEYASKIIAQEVLEHVERPQEILNELVRIGKPGALYLLTVPHPTGEKIQSRIGPSSHFEAPNHINIFEVDEFEKLVVESGLIIESRAQNGFFWSIWMILYWLDSKASGVAHEGATHDLIKPPYPALLNEWTTLWHKIIKMQGGLDVKYELDNLLPKSQIIVARKPGARTEQ